MKPPPTPVSALVFFLILALAVFAAPEAALVLSGAVWLMLLHAGMQRQNRRCSSPDCSCSIARPCGGIPIETVFDEAQYQEEVARELRAQKNARPR